MNSASVVVSKAAAPPITAPAPAAATTTTTPSTNTTTTNLNNNNSNFVASNPPKMVAQQNSSQTTTNQAAVNVTPAPTTTNTTPSQATTTTITPVVATKVNNKNQHQSITTNGSLSDSLASTEGHRTPNVDSLSKTNLYIRGLQSNTSDQDLYNMCARFGQISSTKAILDKATGCCRGYGFVEFTLPKSAELAVQELIRSGIQAQMAKISPLYSSHHHNSNNHHHHHHNSNHHHHHHHHHPHHHNNNNNNNNSSNPTNNSSSGGSSSNNNTSGSSTHASSATNSNNSSSQQHHHYPNSPNSNNADPTNLYIANLPQNMSEQELENLLSNYGPVVSTRILRDLDNIPRGVGFARMESRDTCELIIEQLNGRPYKGWKEPLVVKYADGTKKRISHNNHQHQHQHHNSIHHQLHKSHQDDNRWRDSGGTSDLSSAANFDHQSNISHSNQLPDLAIMNTISYPRMQPGYPPNVAPGSAYQPHLGPPTSAPQWIHPGSHGQPYIIPPQMMQAASLGASNQAAAAAAALHYGHIPQLTSQMQGLQIAHHHHGAPVSGYLPPQHQWSALWPPPMPPQPQPPMRLATTMPTHQPPPAPPPPQQKQQQCQQIPIQQPPPQPQQQPPTSQQQSAVADSKLQVPMPL